MLSFAFNKHTYVACDLTTCAETAIYVFSSVT